MIRGGDQMSSENVYSVSRLAALVKRTLEKDYLLKNIYVAGTITNLKRHSAGHYYFSLKDENASIDIALWKSTAIRRGLVGKLENGLFVIIRAAVNFYEKSGRLSFICNDMELGNKSDQQIAFELLKKQLTEQGYFDQAHKQALPIMPTCIGIVTSSSGAVLHDILHVSKQRNPLVTFKLFAVPVQGQEAGGLIAKGIAMADADPEVELIIVGRGGGSMDDLWCFNDQRVVKALYGAKTPSISAVGHETDYTLCDFAADVRGATPSHAAELAVYPLYQLEQSLQDKSKYLTNYMLDTLRLKRQELDALFNRRLGLPVLTFLHQEKQAIQANRYRLREGTMRQLENKKKQLAVLSSQLEALNPLRIMMKGYARLSKDEIVLTSIKEVKTGDCLRVELQDGQIETEVKEVLVRG